MRQEVNPNMTAVVEDGTYRTVSPMELNEINDRIQKLTPPERVAAAKASVRTFETGANRDVDDDKLDYEGFLSPAVLHRYAQYMHANRKLNDGSLRDSDNWQKGIPLDVYMKSLMRHVMEVWTWHREDPDQDMDPRVMQEALCAVIFNAMGYLYELLKDE